MKKIGRFRKDECLNLRADSPEQGGVMPVVTVDERGRLTIPPEFRVRGTRATLIPAGPFLIVLPIPSRALEASASWLPTKLSRKELKAIADKAARRDALKRAGRRKQA